ncbi:hypothetical protein XEUV315_24280, partial [Xanthomonas euvesicatoria]
MCIPMPVAIYTCRTRGHRPLTRVAPEQRHAGTYPHVIVVEPMDSIASISASVGPHPATSSGAAAVIARGTDFHALRSPPPVFLGGFLAPGRPVRAEIHRSANLIACRRLPVCGADIWVPRQESQIVPPEMCATVPW